MRFLISICLFTTIIIASCRTQKPSNFSYLQDISDTIIRDSNLFKQVTIQKGDALSIVVYSAAHGIRSEADAPYNLLGGASSDGSASGFLVDQNGNIEFPQLGLIHAEGLTREQLAELMKKKLEDFLTQPSVIVRFVNFRITILGEVGSPRNITIPTDRITILEALGLAGDITEFGRKDQVKIIRENNGQVEVGLIDLTKKDMFTSPYFRLQQNDVVYVEQSRRKLQQQEQQAVAQQISIGMSIVTAIALILNIIR